MKGSGAEILLESNPRGKPVEGYIYGTPKPGTLVQIRNAVLVNGRPTFEVYTPTNDGWDKPIFILLPDHLQGKTATDAYATGTRCFVHAALPGEEFNMLYKASSGAVTVGLGLIGDTGTGKLLPQPAATADYATGGLDAEAEVIAAINTLKNRYTSVPFTALEAISDPSDDTLIHVICNGK